MPYATTMGCNPTTTSLRNMRGSKTCHDERRMRNIVDSNPSIRLIESACKSQRENYHACRKSAEVLFFRSQDPAMKIALSILLGLVIGLAPEEVVSEASRIVKFEAGLITSYQILNIRESHIAPDFPCSYTTA
jgi:hypothetical protein